MTTLDEVATDKEIVGLMDKHAEIIQEEYKTIKSDKDEPMPVLLVHALKLDGKKQSSLLMLADLPNEKFDAFRGIGSMVREKESELGQPYCITFSSEAWMAKFDTKNKTETDKLQKKYGGKVSKYPKKYKKEIVMIACLTADRRMAFSSYEIKRDKKGKRTGLKMNMYKPTLDKNMESHMLEGFYVGWAYGEGVLKTEEA